MKLTIHRGANEIGGSCVEVTAGNTRILLDFGMPLGNGLGGEFSRMGNCVAHADNCVWGYMSASGGYNHCYNARKGNML
ncbi:hypothetical protein ACFL3Q_09705 [Planctomycetota bacterium]